MCAMLCLTSEEMSKQWAAFTAGGAQCRKLSGQRQDDLFCPRPWDSRMNTQVPLISAGLLSLLERCPWLTSLYFQGQLMCHQQRRLMWLCSVSRWPTSSLTIPWPRERELTYLWGKAMNGLCRSSRMNANCPWLPFWWVLKRMCSPDR